MYMLYIYILLYPKSIIFKNQPVGHHWLSMRIKVRFVIAYFYNHIFRYLDQILFYYELKPLHNIFHLHTSLENLSPFKH